MKLSPFESTMLTGWEEVFKKAQVSLWILVAIRERKGFVEDIRTFMHTRAQLEISEQSLYRSLRRLESSTLIVAQNITNPHGPDKKHFALTPEGQHVLSAFIERNISRLYLSAPNKTLFQ